MKSVFSAQIARMSLRRQKIAIKRIVGAQLAQFVGQPLSPVVCAEVRRVVFGTFGIPEAEISITYHPQLAEISIPGHQVR